MLKNILISAVLVFILLIFLGAKTTSKKSDVLQTPHLSVISKIPSSISVSPKVSQTLSEFHAPLTNIDNRVTKKLFGTYVTPQNSPIQPEKFNGYHTGIDYETFTNEQNVDIQVHSICAGKLLLKEYATGYGGVAVQLCELNGEPITIIYGHLRLSSISLNTNDNITKGVIIGVLGTAHSSETDGERKHLHLGIHKGTSINILGYVNSKELLHSWIDPCIYVCQK